MLSSAQAFEKNHLSGGQNRPTIPLMKEVDRAKTLKLLLFLALCLGLAILAPVAVLAA